MNFATKMNNNELIVPLSPGMHIMKSHVPLRRMQSGIDLDTLMSTVEFANVCVLCQLRLITHNS